MNEIFREVKKPKINLNAQIIHPDIEPGVIDNEMISKEVLKYGPTGEAGKLFAEEGVHIDETTYLRLEFLNILRIDHLWILKSLTKLTLAHNLIEKIENLNPLVTLKELDLSFNKIVKIENIECLVNLEIFTVFSNKIRKLENMDTLQKLIIFSVGDNLIEDYKESIYLRRFRFLRSVSFKGNPCCDDPMAIKFLKCALPKITFLDYNILTEEEREESIGLFRGVLRKLDEADEKTELLRKQKEEYDAKVEFYAMSFVEYLSGPELVITMFERDPDGSLLLECGGELIMFLEQYKEQYVETMDKLVDYAQIAYNEREVEYKLFKELIDKALADSIENSKGIIAEYVVKKQPIIDKMKKLIAEVKSEKENKEVDPNLETTVMDLTEQFNDMLYDVWKKLMTAEMNLFEQCEESRVQFSVNITEKVTQLLDVSRAAFGSWREIETVWSTRQFETLSKLLGNKVLLGDAKPELYEAMMDRDAMVNLVAASADNHMRFIDDREDTLMTRANKWKTDLVEKTNDNEIARNRDRILEINYYVDNERADWQELQYGLVEPIDPDTVALLQDEF